MTHKCVSKLTIIDSDNGLSPGRRQAIIWTNAGILLIGSLGTNFSEILIEIQTFSFKKMHLKISSAKWWPFCLGLSVLNGTDAFSFLNASGVILMLMSSNGTIFRVTGHLWGETTAHRWILLTKANDAALWDFPWSAPETVEWKIETPVIFYASAPL